MVRVLTVDGSVKIGAFTIPGRKRPAICKEWGETIDIYGYFHDIEAANNFMDELAKLVGAKTE